MVLLHDTEIQNGPTHIASKKETRQILRDGYIKRTDYGGAISLISKLEQSEKNIMVGEKGYAYYFNPTLCMHRAGVPAEGCHRDSFMIIAEPAK